MSTPNWPVLMVVFFVVISPFIWLIATYNGLVRLRNFCRESWSGIDTELKRRYDLIPNLVETVKGYATHEKETLLRVVEARNRAMASNGTPQQQAQDENALVGALKSLFVVVEKYPDLKASQHYLQLQNELVNTEDRIQAARRFYNANVRDFNTRTEVIPSNMVAGLFGFSPTSAVSEPKCLILLDRGSIFSTTFPSFRAGLEGEGRDGPGV